MASLRLTYTDVYTKVSETLGTGSSPGTADLATAKGIALRAYRRWLMPIDASTGKAYQWSFLRQTTTLSTVSGTDTYKLPTGFSSLEVSFKHTTPQSTNPIQKPLDFIYDQKSATTGNSDPLYYAIKTGDYNKKTGQELSVIFNPTPNGVFTYYYTYILTPPAPVDSTDIFIGSELGSEAILELALAVAETQEDGVLGVHSKLAEGMVQALIGADKQTAYSGNIGSMNINKDNGIRRTSVISYDTVQVIP
jgi:hypothetical protein